MINHSAEQIEEAVDSLPLEVQQMLFHPNTEYEVRRIGNEAGLVADQIKTLDVFANFIIMGLLDEKDFEFEIKNDFNISEMQAKEVTEKILKEVIKPIIEFKEKIILKQKAEEEARILDEAEYAEIMKEKETENLLGQKEEARGNEDEEKVTPAKTWEKMPDVAPDNLPIGGVENNLPAQARKRDEGEISPIPTLIPKTRLEGGESEEELHPFEEKMKKVFTGSPTSIGDLALETPTPEKNILIESDPYREPIV